MNLDDLERFKQIDTQNMLGEIELSRAARCCLFPRAIAATSVPRTARISRVLIAAWAAQPLAGSARAYCAPLAKVPVLVHRDYAFRFAHGADTLVSHLPFGDTEETLDPSIWLSAARARAWRYHRRRARSAGIRTQGAFVDLRARRQRGPPIGFPSIAARHVRRLELIPDPSGDLTESVEAMRKIREKNRVTVAAALNPASAMPGS